MGVSEGGSDEGDVFTCCSQRWSRCNGTGCHVSPWLSEFSGVVLNCFTLSNSTIFTDGSLINPEDNLYSLAWVRKLVNGMDGPFLIIFIR